MELNRTLSSALLIATLAIPFGSQATELSANYSAPAVGADMWTGYMGRNGYFVPHYDDCDPASEAFVAVAPDGKGFCVETAERGVTTWYQARNNCLQDSMRLPEPGEFAFACANAGSLGLSGMTDNSEWVSNFAMAMAKDTYNAVAAPIMGFGGCSSGGFGRIASYPSVQDSVGYRCVR